ncbi:MAG: GNAT family N-acetyltransferase [Candidatus Methylumidiphilus sp.]
MSLPAWREEPIAKTHNRNVFDCGDSDLNEYLRRYARQNHESGGAKTFLAVAEAEILGFYSLSPASVAYAQTPELLRRGLGKYEVPAFRLSRLAVDRRMQGQGLGGRLLMAAGRRCLRVASEVGGVALLIDAKNARAADWYASFGAVALLDQPLSLLLPLATIETALQAADKGC